MRQGGQMESDVKLVGSVGSLMGERGSLLGDRGGLAITLMDLNDNANNRRNEVGSLVKQHKLTPDDMENDNELSELSLYRSHHKTPSLEASTGSGYFYDEDFNETNDFTTNEFNDYHDYQNEIGNDSFFYPQRDLIRTRSETCLYELDLSMSERASSQGQSSCGYDAASSADLSLHSDQFSPPMSRADSGAKLFSSVSAGDRHLYSTDSLDHTELTASVMNEDFDIPTCCAKKENYMLAFDGRSPTNRYSDEEEQATYNDAWLSDATENMDGQNPEPESLENPHDVTLENQEHIHEDGHDTDSECCVSEMGEEAPCVYLGDYCSNDEEPLLAMFASNASEALALNASAVAMADTTEFLVDIESDTTPSETDSQAATQQIDDSGCKSASTPSTEPNPSITTGANSTLDDYGSEILGEFDRDLRTSAETDTSYAYDNIFFEAIQHPVHPQVVKAKSASAIATTNSDPNVETNLMTFSYQGDEAGKSDGCKEDLQRVLKRWSNFEGLNDLKKPLATFASIKRSQEDTSSMRTSQSLESLPSETTKSTSSKMTTWQQIKKTRAPQTTWKKICQMKEILKQEDSIYQSQSSKSVPDLTAIDTTDRVVKREKNEEEKDPSKRHSFTLFEIFRRAKSEEDDNRMIPSPVYQRMFASLMNSAESQTSDEAFYLKRSLEEQLKRSVEMKKSLDEKLKNCAVQTSFHEEKPAKSIQTSTGLRRHHSSLDISERGHLVAMTKSSSECNFRDMKASPSKHLTSSMLFSQGNLPDLSFLNRPFKTTRTTQTHDRGQPRSHSSHAIGAYEYERSQERNQGLGRRSQNSIIVHRMHQAPKRVLDNPSVRQLRRNKIDDENIETSDDNEAQQLPPRKPARTFAFEASQESSQDMRRDEAIPLRRLVPRSRSSESARSSSYYSSMDQSMDSQHSCHCQGLDNAGYCCENSRRNQQRSSCCHRSSSGSDEYRSDVSRMSVDSESSHKSDSSGNGQLKSCLTKKRSRTRSSSPVVRRRRHSTGYLDSYAEEGAPHTWDQFDHSLVHRDSEECQCQQCYAPPQPQHCCYGYRGSHHSNQRRQCRLSYPPWHAYRQCCCHGSVDRMMMDQSCSSHCGGNHSNGGHCSMMSNHGNGGGCYATSSSDDNGKGKKSVSFNEEIRYHSPYQSPFASPKRQIGGSPCRAMKSPPLYCDRQDRQCDCRGQCGQPKRRPSESSSVDSAFESESPPREFMISPTKMAVGEQVDESESDESVQSKSDLIHDLFRAVDVVQQHFAGAMDMREKSHLGTSADCPKIGSLLLTQLNPALYNLLGNGLHLRVRSFFGQVKNNVWKMVEESAEMAHTMPVLLDIVKEVRAQLHLRNSSAKFNAFVFGLLNAKALDHWFQVLRTQVKLIRKHYDPDSLVYIFTTLRGRHLFNDTIRSLRPLASLPFRIECNFEYKYKTTFSDESVPEMPMSKSIDSDGLPELLQKTDVRQYIQQAKDWIEGSKLSESAMDYLGQRFYREFGQYSENKKANRWSLPPIETMISLANFFAKSPTEKPSPSLEEFAMYLARVNNQSVSDTSDLKVEKIIENGDVLAKELQERESQSTRAEVKRPVYKRTNYEFENRRVESEPTLHETEHPQQKRHSLPNTGTYSPANQMTASAQKRWSFGNSLINVFDKLLLDQPKNMQEGSKADLPKNMQKMDAPKNMQAEVTSQTKEAKKESEDDTPTPKASPVRTWQAVAKSTGQVSPPPTARKSYGSDSATPTSPLRTWKTVASPKTSCDDTSSVFTSSDDVNANTVPSPVAEGATGPAVTSTSSESSETQSKEVVRPKNLLIRHFNTPRSLAANGAMTRSQESRRQHNAAKIYVQALCHHTAVDSDQLSFSKGDVMLVVKTFERDWYYCCHGNKTGLVHQICVRRLNDDELTSALC